MHQELKNSIKYRKSDLAIIGSSIKEEVQHINGRSIFMEYMKKKLLLFLRIAVRDRVLNS